MFHTIRALFPACILCCCLFAPPKSFAFDYGKYNKERKQLRALEPSKVAGEYEHAKSAKKEKVLSTFTKKLLEAMQSDAVPAKLFERSKNLSFYFKPAKITKIGFKYKF